MYVCVTERETEYKRESAGVHLFVCLRRVALTNPARPKLYAMHYVSESLRKRTLFTALRMGCIGMKQRCLLQNSSTTYRKHTCLWVTFQASMCLDFWRLYCSLLVLEVNLVLASVSPAGRRSSCEAVSE